MSSLFIRLFAAFWLTTLVAIVATHQVGRWLDSDARPSPHQFHERRHAIKRLMRESQHIYHSGDVERLVEWLQSRPIPLQWLVQTPDGRVFSSNGAAGELLASTAPDLSRQRPFIRLEAGRHEIVGRLLRGAEPDPPARLLIALPRPHPLVVELLHRHMWLRLLLAMLATGLISFWLVRRYTRPISELRRATRRLAAGELDTRLPEPARQDEISSLTRDFNTMTHELQVSRNQQQQLIRDISHELRTPLARIQAALALAQRKFGDGAELEHIADNCRELNTMIDQLLSDPRRALQLDDSIDLVALLHAVADDNRLEASSQNKAVAVDSDTDALLIRAAGRELHTAVENVVRNAIRHTRAQTTVRLRLNSGERDRIVIEVRDYGPGVPDAQLGAIFKPFYRLDDARTRASGGYGLGLSIVKRMLEGHGGTVSAANCEDGLLVSMVLPGSLRQEVTANG